MPCSTVQSHLKPVCRQLTYSSSNDSDTSEDTQTAPRATPDAQVYLEEDEEEDFQMVPLDNEHWTAEEVPDRTLCIHEHALPHGLCPYLCPYSNYLHLSYADTLDLSDISNVEDIMITKKLRFALNIILTLIYSINYHLLKSASVNMFLICASNRL